MKRRMRERWKKWSNEGKKTWLENGKREEEIKKLRRIRIQEREARVKEWMKELTL